MRQPLQPRREEGRKSFPSMNDGKRGKSRTSLLHMEATRKTVRKTTRSIRAACQQSRQRLQARHCWQHLPSSITYAVLCTAPPHVPLVYILLEIHHLCCPPLSPSANTSRKTGGLPR